MSDELAVESPASPETKEQLNNKANRLREQRDRLNDETRGHAARRDEINAKVRAIIDQANKHKAERDSLNVQVRAAKDKRDELNALANEKAEALNLLKKDRAPQGGTPVAKLKAEVKRLEFEQQTKVFTPKKEKELIERISALQKEIADKEKTLVADDDLRQAYDEMKAAKAAAEEQHRAVTALAHAAQSEHDAMVKLFGEADKHRKEADAAQADFVKSKVEADRVHHEYIGVVTQIRALDRDQGERRERPSGGHGGPRQQGHPQQQGQGHAVTSEMRAEAEEIFAKFKAGEKLSMEDLMTLQKAGLL